ncbi:hypothetical protein BJ508DRAFT_143744 [Ascobolus immersus RN42]|uniref:DH domain-containing protein n=1 Tax=Ascobolus immersus RN42 TaxID=1160509 RepID=A0A3N4IC61_ASCIM|nr:hypothetical protein BJ508DRAFT_143744 [Ascobolus immersus RN42]
MTIEIDQALLRGQNSPNGLPPLGNRDSTTSFGSNLTLVNTSATASTVITPVSTNSNIMSAPVGNGSLINKKADPAQGLFQTCATLRERLRDVEGFEKFFEKGPDASDDIEDPVSQLWTVFRKGSSLCALFNSLMPKTPIDPKFTQPNLATEKEKKQAIFHFLKGIKEEMGLVGEDVFMISELYSEDTNGFVKVTKVVARILDELQARGLLMKRSVTETDALSAEKGPMSNRSKVVQELVDTERKYVQDLEVLQSYMNALTKSEIVTLDFIHMMFLNLNSLVDFQRRFLIKVESLNILPPEQQRWGKLFLEFEETFDVYEPYCANFKAASDLAYAEQSRLAKLPHPVSSAGVAPFLIKPVQRICKYPLLLREMIKYSDPKDPMLPELKEGMESVERINAKVNEAIRKKDMAMQVEELSGRVDDWKGHKLESFGDLLLCGQFPIVKSDAKGEVERESNPNRQYHIYMFESILLCCKELAPAKRQNRSMRRGTQQTKGAATKPPLQLKGRIFVRNITNIVSLAKSGNVGSYTLQIFWRGDSSTENFIIRHRNEESLSQWNSLLMRQYDLFNQMAGPNAVGRPSATAFAWDKMNESGTSGAYGPDDDDEETLAGEDDSDHDVQGGSNFHMSRNGSSSSLRAYQDAASMSPPPPLPIQTNSTLPTPRSRFQQQLGAISNPLSLNTNTSHLMGSPPNASYFSPTMETPHGSRGSGLSGMYPFPRQATPNYAEESSRYPGGVPMGRSGSREGTSPGPAQQSRLTRPSLPGMASHPGSNNLNQPRGRSASSPNIKHIPNPQQYGRGSGIPPVPTPPIPQQYQAYSVNRSIAGSPTSPLNGSIRNGSPAQDGIDGISRPPTRNTPSPQVKVRVHFGADSFVIIVPYSITYEKLIERIRLKIHTTTGGEQGSLRVKYEDEEGDYISIFTDDDVQIAFDSFSEQGGRAGEPAAVVSLIVTA